MIFKIIIYSFLLTPLRNVQINNPDIDFNNDLNVIINSIGAIGYFLPKFLRNNEPCKKDDDCPLIMRCCEVGLNNYCCTPNNFVHIKPAFSKQEIQK